MPIDARWIGNTLQVLALTLVEPTGCNHARDASHMTEARAVMPPQTTTRDAAVLAPLDGPPGPPRPDPRYVTLTPDDHVAPGRYASMLTLWNFEVGQCRSTTTVSRHSAAVLTLGSDGTATACIGSGESRSFLPGGCARERVNATRHELHQYFGLVGHWHADGSEIALDVAKTWNRCDGANPPDGAPHFTLRCATARTADASRTSLLLCRAPDAEAELCSFCTLPIGAPRPPRTDALSLDAWLILAASPGSTIRWQHDRDSLVQLTFSNGSVSDADPQRAGTESP